MAVKTEVVRQMQKPTSDSSSEGQALSDRHVHFIFRQILRKKQNGSWTGSSSSQAKNKTGFVLRRSSAFR